MSEEIKLCPYCAEEIKAAAIVCKHCGRELPGFQAYKESYQYSKKNRWQGTREKITDFIKRSWETRRPLVISLITLLVLCYFCVLLFVFAGDGAEAPTDTPEIVSTTPENDISEPTRTLLPTYTVKPTNTSTYTPMPETETALAMNATRTQIAEFATETEFSVNSTQTQIAEYATGTVFSANATRTQKAESKTETHEAYWGPRTATAKATHATATKIAEYKSIPGKEIATYPEAHVGEQVFLYGKIFNINGNTEFQIWINGNYDYSLYIIMDKAFSGIYIDDWVTVYGMVLGESCGSNAFGGEVCTAVLAGDFFIKK